MASYAQFAEENKALLESLPAPDVAKAYYEGDDLYMFDEFQTTTFIKCLEVMSLKLDKDGTTDNAYVDRKHVSVRRPKMKTLYDVFINICEDEKEHIETMNACQIDGDFMHRVTLSDQKSQHDYALKKLVLRTPFSACVCVHSKRDHHHFEQESNEGESERTRRYQKLPFSTERHFFGLLCC